MLFEVVDANGRGVMCTEHINCVPDKNVITSMSSAGYRFKLNGKYISKKALIEFINTKSK